MHVLVIGSLAALLVSQTPALITEGSGEEVQDFLARDWGFEYRQSNGSQVVRAVCARQIEETQARKFVSSLRALERLDIEFSRLAPGDIRSLARHCPSLNAIHVTRDRGPEALEAALWPEFFEFQKLKHLSVESLHCLGDEQWIIHGSRDLDTLAVSGNLSGMLSALLAPYKMSSLRVELQASRQQLTAADYAALNSHTEIEALEIGGDRFGGGMVVDLNALSGLRKLQRLTLRQCSVDPLNLHRFPTLRALTLQTCRFIKHDFDSVLTHPGLEELTLWECNNEDLRMAGPYSGPTERLREITLRFPVFTDIEAFRGLSCSYHVQFGLGGMCVPTAKAHTLRWIGQNEVASLEQLKELRSVSVIGGLPGEVKVSAAALVRLTHVDTLRRLEVRDVDLVPDSPPGHREQSRGIEEVRFLTSTPLSRELFARFLGAKTRQVLIGDYSDNAKAERPWGNTTHYTPKQVGLAEITLPVCRPCLELQLLTSSVEALVLDSCSVKKGAIQQLVARLPSLKSLTLDTCLIEDERELLYLNELTDLKSVDFANTTVSASIARGMKTESVRFGTWPRR